MNYFDVTAETPAGKWKTRVKRDTPEEAIAKVKRALKDGPDNKVNIIAIAYAVRDGKDEKRGGAVSAQVAQNRKQRLAQMTRLLQSSGATQGDLASILGIPRSTVSEYLTLPEIERHLSRHKHPTTGVITYRMDTL